MRRIKATLLTILLLAAAALGARPVLAQGTSNPEPNAPPAAAGAAPAEAAQESATPAAAANATTASSAQTAALASMDPNDVRALLYKIYTSAYRLTDLASTLQLANLKISDQDRAALQQKLDNLRAALATLEKPRAEFYNNPASDTLGRQTLSALKALLPQLQDFETTLAQSAGAAQAKDYQQPAADLATLANRLEPYVSYLEAGSTPPAPAASAPPATATTRATATAPGAGAEIKTEEIQVSKAPVPLTSASTERPPLNPAELKQLLYKAYVPAFRVKDLLNQEQPERWRASTADQTAFNEARQVLEKRLVDLETWRGQFAESPQSLEDAFQTYRALWNLLEPIGTVSRIVGQDEDAKEGAEYHDRGQEMADVGEKLVPYITYLARYHDQTVQMFQENLMACENQLGYAMRPRAEAAVPMKNVIPVFQGRRRTRSQPPAATPQSTSPTKAKKRAKS